MCLAVPGKIIEILNADNPLEISGRVSFGGIVKEVSLVYTPDAVVGEFVLVHVGFALNKVDPAEAERVFEYLRQIDELDEIEAVGDVGQYDADQAPKTTGEAAP